jgi:hypothetical protein
MSLRDKVGQVPASATRRVKDHAVLRENAQEFLEELSMGNVAVYSALLVVQRRLAVILLFAASPHFL